jgi:uncharacterized protein
MHYRAAMRAFGLFLAAILVTLVAAAALAYPVYLIAAPLWPGLEFHKLASRLWQGLMFIAVVVLVRRLRLTSRADFGYGTARARWLAEAGTGIALGLLTMFPVTVLLLALGVRTPLAPGVARLGHLIGSAALSGLAVGLLEETFFRGLLQGAVRRELGQGLLRRALALALVALLYAALHFLARVPIPAAELGPLSGVRLLSSVGASFFSFGSIADAFLALTAVGLLLGLAREYTGSIALSLGLHAGWVFVMRLTIGLTAPAPAAHYAWLVSRSDGYTGWLVLALTVLLILASGPLLGRYRAGR